MYKSLFTILRWPLLLLVVHGVLSVGGRYQTWGRVDNIMHFLGGASTAAAAVPALQLFQRRKWLGNLHPLMGIFITVAIVALAAVCWELFEFILDYTFSTGMQGDAVDTTSDLFLGTLGGLIVAVSKMFFATPAATTTSPEK